MKSAKLALALLPLLATLLALGSCAPENASYIQPIDYAGAPPINLSVATTDIVDEYVPPMALPNVEHAAPTPPYKAVRTWATERLHAQGSGGFIRIGIKDAHIVEKKLIGQFEYDGRIDVAVDITGADGSTATAEVSAEHQVTVDDDISLADKEGTWDNLTRDMMADFDKGMNAEFTTGTLAKYVVKAPIPAQ